MNKNETPVWNKIFMVELQQPAPTLLTTSQEFLRAKQWREAHKALAQLAFLEPNWDGEGAEAPDAEIIASGVVLFDQLHSQGERPPTRVQPTPEGGVVVEWGSPNHYREVEIAEPFCGEEMTVEGGAPAIHESLVWKNTAADILQSSAESSANSEFSYYEPARARDCAATA